MLTNENLAETQEQQVKKELSNQASSRRKIIGRTAERN